MLNEKQINLIISAIEAEKNMLLKEIMQLNQVLSKKNDALSKIEQYHNEYFINQSQRISFKIPALCHNYENFLKKIQSIIAMEKKAIEDVESNRDVIFERVEKVNNKIKAMNLLLEKLNQINKNKNEMNSEIEQSDLISHKILGGNL